MVVITSPGNAAISLDSSTFPNPPFLKEGGVFQIYLDIPDYFAMLLGRTRSVCSEAAPTARRYVGEVVAVDVRAEIRVFH